MNDYVLIIKTWTNKIFTRSNPQHNSNHEPVFAMENNCQHNLILKERSYMPTSRLELKPCYFIAKYTTEASEFQIRRWGRWSNIIPWMLEANLKYFVSLIAFTVAIMFYTLLFISLPYVQKICIIDWSSGEVFFTLPSFNPFQASIQA